jgi:hypothetical protein
MILPIRHCERSSRSNPRARGDCFVGTPALAGGARENTLLAMTGEKKEKK